mmetsp:Transcript_12453/g.29679  ORF Transcript_12453/g.29679 Transcript_12453/m.29679 type:complete len:386 (+) Transcript_12453:86-1243(+)
MSEPGELSLDNSFDKDINDEANPAEASNNNVLASPAQTLVEMAAYRIDLDPSKVKFLLHIMKEELITETWQLHYMDSANWRDMGFPIGLVASIRRLMHEKDMAESGHKLHKNEYGFNGHPSDEFGCHASRGTPLFSNAASLNSSHQQAPTNDDDDESSTTEPETSLMSPELPLKEAEFAPEPATDEGPNTRRMSDITLSERLSTRLHISSPHAPKQKLGSSKNESQAIKTSTRDRPPVSAPRRSSQKWLNAVVDPPARSPTRSSSRSSSNRHKAQNLRTSMPLRPLRRPTIHDTPNMKFDLDDLSDTESFAVESVGMVIVGSKESEEKAADLNNASSMAVVTANFGDMRDLLVGGVDPTIDEVGESESKLSEGSKDSQDPTVWSA